MSGTSSALATYTREMSKVLTPAAEHARYAITYFDPEDEEGMRERTWMFETKEDAEEWRRELEVVWGVGERGVGHLALPLVSQALREFCLPFIFISFFKSSNLLIDKSRYSVSLSIPINFLP